jgi:hypothetical protein
LIKKSLNLSFWFWDHGTIEGIVAHEVWYIRLVRKCQAWCGLIGWSSVHVHCVTCDL